ncbi:leucine-rich repeat domain-containing protein [Eubacterium sp.]|uniref:leucine-rich repeat domain-containing protein n=1 Tax=Eubacterium sp. TaxID=142586 RepID=UPI0025F9A1A4|nr:leucine-rich repeat domain-containing protein [Eubacterium sp.]MCR5630164.1 leucine-rich repeat domain-containing protein [Eubacterium sp.]
MRFKQVRRKATAIALSAAMAFSVNVATPTSVKAAEKTTITQRVGTIFDMKEATVAGEIDLGFLEGYKLPLAPKGEEPGEGGEKKEEPKYYNPDYSYDVMDMLYSAKFQVSDAYENGTQDEVKAEYDEYLTKIGFLKKVEVAPFGEKIVNYEPNFKKLTAKVRFDGKLTDKYNGTYNVYLTLCNLKEVKLAELKVVNGKFLCDPLDIGKALGYYIDEKPNKVISKLFKVPVSVSSFELDLIDSLRTEFEEEYEYYKAKTKQNPDNSRYARNYAKLAIGMNMFKHIEKVSKTDDSSAIGRTFIDVAEKALPVLGVAVDNCYDKASVTKDGKTTLALDENSLFTLMDEFTLDLVKKSKTLKDKAKSITSLLFENESEVKYLDEVNKTVDGFIDSKVDSYKEYASAKIDDRKKALENTIKGFLEQYKGITFTDSLTGEKGGRDFEADGKVAIPFVGMDHLMYVDSGDPSDMTAYQELSVGLKLSIKEPDAGKVKPAPEKMGPKVGSTIKDKNCSYKVITQGSDKKVGEVEVKKANKKNVKKVVIKGTVKINGVKYKVTSIGANAFKGNKKLTKVTIGKYVKRIKKNAFAGCSALKTVVSKSKVLSRIDKGAFAKDAKLTSVNFKLSTKLNKIAKGAFKGVKKSCKISVNKKLKKKLVKKLKKAGCKATVK